MNSEPPPPIDRQREQQAQLLAEMRKRPWLAYCGLFAMGTLVAAVILNVVLKRRVDPLTHHGIVTLIHLAGIIAGLITLFASPPSIRAAQKNLRFIIIVNAVFLLLFGYRTLRLLQHKNAGAGLPAAVGNTANSQLSEGEDSFQEYRWPLKSMEGIAEDHHVSR